MQVDLGLIQGQEDHLEKEMETHSSTFAWKILSITLLVCEMSAIVW